MKKQYDSVLKKKEKEIPIKERGYNEEKRKVDFPKIKKIN